MLPSRGRTIAALILTALVLVTFDSRGSAALDQVRQVFGSIAHPFVVAADVVTQPVRDVWAAATEVDDLRAENAALRSERDGATADLIAAENAIIQANELKELVDLDSLAGIPKVAGDIVGDSPSNFEQRVELGIGSEKGVRVGMPVISGGLVGKVTSVKAQSCEVMLVTDAQYYVRVKIVSSPDSGSEESTPVTTPSGLELEGLDDAIAASTTTEAPIVEVGSSTTSTASSTTEAPPTTESTVAASSTTNPGDPLDPSVTLPPSESSTTTTTSIPVYRETGSLHGNGGDRLPSITFVSNSKQFGQIQIGDAVLTGGGSKSLAPADIPVGRVVNIIPDNGVDGMQVEVELTSDLDQLNFLTVLLYQPQTELSGG